MLKMAALSASVLVLASGLAFAETPMTKELSPGGTVAANPKMGHWRVSNIYKANVYDPSEQKVGDVIDLMIDSNGTITAAVISVGSGFLGVNQKDVVIPFSELKVTKRDGKDWIVLHRTKDELKMAPAYNETGAPSEYRGR